MATMTHRATFADLMKTEGRAELIAGRIVRLPAMGFGPSRAALAIAMSLDEFANARSTGVAFSSGLGYTFVELSSGRESFQPDASWYSGMLPENAMAFVWGAPDLAVEVRREADYDATSDERFAQKRVDYFEAGTRVIWDVDTVGRVIAKYTVEAPESPTIFMTGDEADAEPALSDWRMSVEAIFSD